MVKGAFNWLLAGVPMPQATMAEKIGPDYIDDIEINIPTLDDRIPALNNDIATPNFPEIGTAHDETMELVFHEDEPKQENQKTSSTDWVKYVDNIEYVDGDSVHGGNMGWCDYASATMFIPNYKNFLKEVEGTKDEDTYLPLVKAIQRYTIAHEAFAERFYMRMSKNKTEEDHARGEALTLKTLIREGDLEAYEAGLFLHYVREANGDKDKFTHKTKECYDVDGELEKLDSAYLDKMAGLIEDIISGKPTRHYQTGDALDYRTGVAGMPDLRTYIGAGDDLALMN